MLISRHFSAIGNISRQKIDSGLNGFNVTVWLELPKWQYFTASTADNLFKNLPIDFKLQQSGWIKGWVVLGGNSCWGGWWVVWWLRWGKACRLPLCWASTHFKPHLGFRNQRNTVYTKKRNRINRIREIHGGWWCGRKVACYQLSGCCGRSSQASTSIWTPHLAFPFPHHHTSALPHSEPTQNKSDTLFTKLCMHFVDFVKLSSVSSQRQKYYTCHIGFGTTGQQREFLDVFRSVFS